jgi:DNA polymerase-4
MGRERDLIRATVIAYAIKREILAVGSTLRCSVGLAPNRLQAMIVGDMQKPDGLMIFEQRNLPQPLYGLDLSDIPGIGSCLEERVRAAEINTVKELCSLSRDPKPIALGSTKEQRPRSRTFTHYLGAQTDSGVLRSRRNSPD